MRIYKDRTIPPTSERTETYLAETRCDLCGRIAEKGHWGERVAYYYEHTLLKVSVYHEKGDSFPDGGNYGEIAIIDMCPDCFRNKLIPWINSQGGDVTYKDTIDGVPE